MADLGSKYRPITIDLEDSEDEVQHDLTTHTPGCTSCSGSPVIVSKELPSQDPRRSFSELKETLKTSFSLLGNGRGSDEPQPSSPTHDHHKDNKRRRSNSIETIEGQPPNKQGRTSLQDRLSSNSNQAMSKSAKKRLNKAEKNKRIHAENLRRLHQDNPYRHNPQLIPNYPPGVGPSSDVNHIMMLPFNQMSPTDPGYRPPPMPRFIYPQPDQFLKPETWVESMAWTPTPTMDPYAMYNQYGSPPEPDIAPPSLPPITATYPTSVPLSRPIPTGPKADTHGLPPKPSSQINLSIGMKPDQDPNSKHGIYKVIGLDPTNPYIPNPARTLVMEQLPKPHRNADYINAWAKRASGQLPLKVLIDSSGAKALIEFPTAELARKAWESPRLGAAYAGLKSHQLKGKSRDDLIRVWWYRVDGVGAGSGVGEIEEGEIEGDSQEFHDADSPHRKETKKERKERLLKYRNEKLQREQDARMEKDAHQRPNPVHNPLAAPPHAVQEAHHWNPILPPRPSTSSRPFVQVQTSHHAGHSLVVDGMDLDLDQDDDDMEIASPNEPMSNGTFVSQPHFPIIPDLNGSSVGTPSTLSSTPTESKPSGSEDLKTALFARQKELEDQIARRRNDLARLQISSNDQGVDTGQGEPNMDDRLDMLRKRVRQSQKSKQAATITKPPPSLPSPVDTKAASNTPPAGNPPVSFEEMAVDFITQTIETVVRSKSPPQPSKTPVPPAPTRSTSSNNKAELELKTRQLEQHIAQTKLLMKQMLEAKTKDEKDHFRTKLRELDQQQSGQRSSPPTSSHLANIAGGIVKSAASKVAAAPSCWPRFELENSVLILSDDEDD